jgi:predicted SAM-dependent methyltransferase
MARENARLMTESVNPQITIDSYESIMSRLDIGCGSNKKNGFLGVDVGRTEATDVIADAANLPFRGGSVDYVHSRRCVQHIREDVKALKEMYRVLRTNGKLEVITASFCGFLFYRLGLSESSGKYEVFHLYSNRRLRKMLKEAGFSAKVDISKIKSVRRWGHDLMAICEKGSSFFESVSFFNMGHRNFQKAKYTRLNEHRSVAIARPNQQ